MTAMTKAERARHEEARWLSQPTTPRENRPRASWGSLIFQTPNRGLCPQGKCLRKGGHEGLCWPNH